MDAAGEPGDLGGEGAGEVAAGGRVAGAGQCGWLEVQALVVDDPGQSAVSELGGVESVGGPELPA